MYERVIKRLIDIVFSSIAMVILAIPMLIVSAVIKLDDPGPVLFMQKRIGQNKNGQPTYFTIWKFRSMRMDTPHDIPTHLLESPEQYITRAGRFIRKTSIDELPQIYQVFIGKISFIGPRPGLWNQTDLWEERQKYGANDVKPGLTGWAQVNGRDELEIPAKAKYDGEYAAALKAGRFKGLAMDAKCFFKTVAILLKSDGVVEGCPHASAQSEELQKEEVR